MARFPFRRVFLDTNIIRFLGTLPSHFFEGGFDDGDGDKVARIESGKLLRDIDILQALPQLFRRGVPHALVITDDVVEELPRHVQWYGYQFLQWCRDMGWTPEVVPVSPTGGLAEDLDAGDRRLYLQAVALGCDSFMTTDYRSIIRRRHKLLGFHTKPITPFEWWRGMQPWAGLFL
jgi:hypothetical protein